ncbi:MAG: hypothetical protein JKY14_02605, partial [Paraglaciecola sp.]|nr:hypothetical protein [Paraglaciecola sp.]
MKKIKAAKIGLVEEPLKSINGPQAVSTPSGASTGNGASAGAAMDRKIAPQSNLLKRTVVVLIGMSVLALLVYWLLNAPSGKALSVATDRIAISTVKSGIFEDFIPIRGR